MAINAVIDISHHNGHPNFQTCKSVGVLGVIHKSSQGVTYRDSMYTINKRKVLDAGLMWGAYHFGTYGNGALQAATMLDVVRPDDKTLLVLDYEPNVHSQMRLEQARGFIAHI